MPPINFNLIAESSLHEVNQKLDTILGLLGKPLNRTDQGLGNWVSEKEAQELTGKRGTSLWHLRVKGFLTYTKINNRVFYDRESILSLLEKNKKESFRR